MGRLTWIMRSHSHIISGVAIKAAIVSRERADLGDNCINCHSVEQIKRNYMQEHGAIERK